MLAWMIWIPAAALLGALALWSITPYGDLRPLLEEGGLIEVTTVLFYLIAAFALCTRLRHRSSSRADIAALIVVMLFFAARELDLHLRFTGTSVLRVSYYLSGSFGVAKAVALLLICTFMVSLVFLVVRHAGTFLKRLRARDTTVLAACSFIAVLLLSKVLDRSASILTEDFGVALSIGIYDLIQACEELGELALPVIVAVAAVGALPPARLGTAAVARARR